MVVRGGILIQAFLGYLVAHVPIVLAVSYWSGAAGLVWNVVNSVVIVALALSFRPKRFDSVTRAGAILILVCVVGLAIQSTFLDSVAREDLLFIGKMASCIGVYTIAVAAAERYEFNSSELTSAVFVGIIFCLVSMVISIQLGLGSTVVEQDVSYEGGVFGVSSSVALFSGYLSGISVINAFARPRFISKITWHIVGVAAVLVTLRRTAWISLCAQYLSIAAMRRSIKSLSTLGVVLLLLGLLAWRFAPSIPAQLYDGITIRALGLTGESIGSGRAEIYRLAAGYLADCGPVSCWSGVGAEYLKEWMARDFGMSIGSHTLFLDLGIRFGWPALALGMVFFLSLARKILRTQPSLSRDAGLMSLSHIFVFAVFSGLAFDMVMWPGFIFLGLMKKRS